jgi:hypothetical protein
VISDEYRRLNELLHESDPAYGSGSGLKYAGFVKEAMRRTGSTSVLDYGCGKGSLRKALGEFVENYDPAVPEWSGMPPPADLVVCTDVLEHVEPDQMGRVVAHIRSLTLRAAFFVIACREARKTLADGRNAHLTVKPPEWWIDMLSSDFKPVAKHVSESNDLMMVCT